MATAKKPSKQAAKEVAVNPKTGKPYLKRGPKNPMRDDHKAALAQGRNEGNVVKAYLEALRDNKPRRGRRRTKASIAARMAVIDATMDSAGVVDQLRLRQEKLDLWAELERMSIKVDLKPLEDRFVAVGKSYSTRLGVSYLAWREMGVSAAVLKRAGISRAADKG